jgi:hypothetical protein
MSHNCLSCTNGCKTTYYPVLYIPEQDAILYLESGFRLQKTELGTQIRKQTIEELQRSIGTLIHSHPSRIQYAGCKGLQTPKTYFQKMVTGFIYTDLLRQHEFFDHEKTRLSAKPRKIFTRTANSDICDVLDMCLQQNK